MRTTTLLRTLLDLNNTRVLRVSLDDESFIVDVAPTWHRPRCSECGSQGPAYDRDAGRQWRHLDLAGMKVVLRYDIRRVNCPKCQAVKVERVPWAETSSWFTVPFEDHVAYLAQRCDQTTVSTTMRIRWQTVGAVVQRVVARRRTGDLPRLRGSTRLHEAVLDGAGVLPPDETTADAEPLPLGSSVPRLKPGLSDRSPPPRWTRHAPDRPTRARGHRAGPPLA